MRGFQTRQEGLSYVAFAVIASTGILLQALGDTSATRALIFAGSLSLAALVGVIGWSVSRRRAHRSSASHGVDRRWSLFLGLLGLIAMVVGTILVRDAPPAFALLMAATIGYALFLAIYHLRYLR